MQDAFTGELVGGATPLFASTGRFGRRQRAWRRLGGAPTRAQAALAIAGLFLLRCVLLAPFALAELVRGDVWGWSWQACAFAGLTMLAAVVAPKRKHRYRLVHFFLFFQLFAVAMPAVTLLLGFDGSVLAGTVLAVTGGWWLLDRPELLWSTRRPDVERAVHRVSPKAAIPPSGAEQIALFSNSLVLSLLAAAVTLSAMHIQGWTDVPVWKELAGAVIVIGICTWGQRKPGRPARWRLWVVPPFAVGGILLWRLATIGLDNGAIPGWVRLGLVLAAIPISVFAMAQATASAAPGRRPLPPELAPQQV